MKQKINLRLIGIAVIAVLATAIGITFIYYGLFKKQVQAGLRTNAEVLMETGVFEKSSQYADVKLPINNLRVTWIDSDGVVLFDNDNDINVMPNHKDRPEIQDAFHTGHGQCVRNSDTMDMNTFYYALKQKDGTVIRVSCDASSLLSVFGNVFPAVTGILAVIIVVCIVLSQLLTRTLIEPIERMAKNMDSVQEKPVYKEIAPFAEKIRTQHENILAAARSRQDFTANVSHELKTPIALIQGYAEGLKDNVIEDDESKEFYCDVILDEAGKMNRLVKQLLNLNELEFGMNRVQPVAFDINVLMRNVVGSSSILIEQNHADVELPEALNKECNVYADEFMIEQVFTNYFTNALHYCNDGGKVKIWTAQTDYDEPRKVDDGEITGNLRVFVYDEGPNIPTDELDKVFIKFYKVDKARTREYGGSGIGLSIVAASMAAHNKNYGVYNVEDGVVFYFDLDVIKQDGDEPGLLPENTEDNTTENVSEQ